MNVTPYELPCGCYLRLIPEGGYDELRCKVHAQKEREAILKLCLKYGKSIDDLPYFAERVSMEEIKRRYPQKGTNP